MIKTGAPLLGVLWLSMICAAGANAQSVEVGLDPAQTQIHFTLGATMHTVRGTFRLKSGRMDFDAATGKAGGEIVIDATSGDTGSDGRDRKMHKDVLESGKYPEIVFVPQQVEGGVALGGSSQFQIRGVIRLHGSEHPLTIPVKSGFHDGKLQAMAHFDIPYVEWGLRDPSTFILRVDKTVKIEIIAIVARIAEANCGARSRTRQGEPFACAVSCLRLSLGMRNCWSKLSPAVAATPTAVTSNVKATPLRFWGG